MNKMYKRAYIEITNVCNLNCSFCPIDQRQQDVMSLEDFTKIVTQAAPLAEQLCLHLMGEPLAHPKFKDIIAICSNHDSRLQLTTNGLLLKRHTDLILNSDIVRQVNISLQSYMDNFPNKDILPYLNMIYDFIEKSK
ncbi:MAG: radical SAM protein, partial [Bacteriovoracaceae bacterium]|nr:radical SAM protein [Bacteriovoracaceae bacterium]